MRGSEDQIQNSDHVEDCGATFDDFSDIMESLTRPSSIDKNQRWVALTGVVGYYTAYLHRAWLKYGKQKLPRKLKKRVYLNHKLRKQYLPEYYL